MELSAVTKPQQPEHRAKKPQKTQIQNKTPKKIDARTSNKIMHLNITALAVCNEM
jgi:hypothetical protein